MSRKRIAFLTLVIFLLGAVAGAMGMRVHDARDLLLLGKGRPPHPAEIFKRRLVSELDLDPGQRKTVEGIVDATHHDIQAILSKVRPEVEARLQQSATDIRAVLNPDQKRTFDQMEAERKALDAERDKK